MKTELRKWMLIMLAVLAVLVVPLPVLAGGPLGASGALSDFHASGVGGSIEGYVTHENGTGIYNVSVYASGPGNGSTSTDNAGHYSISGLSVGYYNLWTYAEDDPRLLSRFSYATVLDGETTAVDFVLPMGGEIGGRVTDEDGIGVYDAQVYANGPSSGEAYTDNQGYYVIIGLEGGTHEVSVSPAFGANLLPGVTTVQVTRSETTALDFVLLSGGAIAGRVTDGEGAGVQDACVQASGPTYGETYTDNQGYYSIIALPAGAYDVSAVPPEEADLLNGSTTAKVNLGETTTANMVLAAAFYGAVDGWVTDNYGVAVSGVRVSAGGPADYGDDYSDSSGYYFIDDLLVGTYTVTASPSAVVNLLSSSTTDVLVEDNTTTTVSFVLPWGGIIEGRVTDGEGAGVSSAYVSASGPSGKADYTDADGYYSIVGLVGGSYSVNASRSGSNLLPGSDAAVVTEGSTTTLDFVLAEGGIIEGLVTNEEMSGLYFAHVSATGPRYGYDYSETDGSYSIVGLRTGTYSVTAQPPSGAPGVNLLAVTHIVDVVEGGTTPLDFVLPWGGTISGRVTDGEGAGVPYAEMYASGPVGRGSQTDEDGYYFIYGLLTGSYTVTAGPPYWLNLIGTAATVEVTQGDNTTQDFVVSEGGIIAGRVTDGNGAGVYNAFLMASGAYGGGHAYTDWDGYYSIPGLPSDNYDVTVSPPDSVGLLSVNVTAEVIEGDTTVLDPVLPWGGMIGGRVMDGAGMGIPYAYIEAYGEAAGGEGYAYTAWDGCYFITGLPSDNYSITATPMYQPNLDPRIETAEVIQGEITTVDFVLQIVGPTLVYPADGTATVDTTPWLDWSDVTDPSGVHYQVQVDNDADFSSPVVYKTWVSLSSTTLSELPEGMYYWRVRAVNGAGTPSAWTDPWSFTITPPVPALVYPESWTKTKDNTPWLDWSDVTSGVPPVRYWLQVDDDADFSSPVVDKSTGTWSSNTLPVMPDGLYYWRVRSVNDAGIASNWSGSRVLRIDTTAPSAPVPVYPVNGKAIKDNTPWLDWSDVTDVSGVRYQIQVDDNADFSSPEVNKTKLTRSSTTMPVLADGVYYWRVRAVDGANNVGDWSDVWTVTIDTVVPAVPALAYPSDGTTTADNTPWLDWSDVTDATGVTYQLQVDNNADFSSPVVNKSGLTVSSRTLSTLSDGAYYWRVRVVDGAGNASAWTAAWSFTVDT